jgi:hypothetical protein
LKIEDGDKYGIDINKLALIVKSLEFPPHRPMFTKTDVSTLAILKDREITTQTLEVRMPYIEG